MLYPDHMSKWPRSHVLAAILALVALTGVFDYLTGAEISVGIFYLIPVSLAAWVLGGRSGALVATASAVVWFASDVAAREVYSHPLVPFWNASVRFGFFFLFAVLLAEFKAAWIRGLERDIEIAREIQQRLLPTSIPSWPGVEIAVRLLPVHRLSGDYYDFSQSPDGLGVFVADVVGKGVSAGLLMANLHALFHSAHLFAHGPEDICATIGRMNAHLIAHTTPTHFATVFHALFPPGASRFTYLSAGHPPLGLLLTSQNNSFDR